MSGDLAWGLHRCRRVTHGGEDVVWVPQGSGRSEEERDYGGVRMTQRYGITIHIIFPVP